MPPGEGDCETVVSGGGRVACETPGVQAHCGLERCESLSVTCVAGELVADAPARIGMPLESRCALAAPNATIDVSVGTSRYVFRHAYVEHGVGFATYIRLTFTTDGDADVCTQRRLTIGYVGADVETTGGAYDGPHEVDIQLTDETLDPPYRFATGRLDISASLPFRMGGPVSGTLGIIDTGLSVSGSFTDAAECMPWRTSGS